MAGISCGIVGLPNVGKSTIFNAITKSGADAANYPFCTIEPNVGIVQVVDERVDRLYDIDNAGKKVYTAIEFVDIAGLVKGASKGEGRGNQFLENIHHVDAIVHVVRCFEDDNITHVNGKIDPVDDIETINLELILADLQMTENAIVRLTKKARGNDKEALAAVTVMQKIAKHLEEEKPLRTFEFSGNEEEKIYGYRFLTAKKVIYAVNVAEDDLPEMENEYVLKVRQYAKAEGNSVVPFCAKIEEDISSLRDEEASEFLTEMGIKEAGLNRLVKECYSLLGLISFLTSGEIEAKAWTIKKGTKAPQAAAVIHTDFEKGFIRVEITPFKAIDQLGSAKLAKEKGLMRVEGKDYVMQDGDVTFFRVSTR